MVQLYSMNMERLSYIRRISYPNGEILIVALFAYGLLGGRKGRMLGQDAPHIPLM